MRSDHLRSHPTCAGSLNQGGEREVVVKRRAGVDQESSLEIEWRLPEIPDAVAEEGVSLLVSVRIISVSVEPYPFALRKEAQEQFLLVVDGDDIWIEA